MGKRIETAMYAASLNQTSLAALMGVSPQAVQQWISDETAPKRKRLEKLAQVLRVSVAELVTDCPTTGSIPDIANLMLNASPATQDILKTLERGMQEGRLSQDDIKLLEIIAKRLIGNTVKKTAEDSASYGKLFDEAKKNHPTE
ncbi:MAG: helix-turn-helix domain-containing protein [Porticoccaceae bacterium]|nr:helix-turn-helix domain-containing protein [Porticoccaceae bacterium]